MLRLILASVLLTATRIIASEETNSTGNGIFGTPPPPTLDDRAIGDLDRSAPCGSCAPVSIFRCDHLYRLYQKPTSTLTSDERSMLRNSFCRWSYGAPYVCCPKPTPAPPTKIPKPSVSKTNTPKTLPAAAIGCGLSPTKFRKKVTGGEPAQLGSWPWMAALYRSSSGEPRYTCGGSLIAKEWVLTAAHCIPPGITLSHVRLGDLHLNVSVPDQATPVEIKIKEVIKHAEYKEKPSRNDIALLRLSRPVQYTDYIRPICLHTDKKYLGESYYEPKKPFIAGWGVTSFLGTQSLSLLEAEIETVDRTTCLQNYDKFVKSGQIQIDEKVMCANAPGKDTCQGDSGGPLMFHDPPDPTWYQGGIVSVGFECGREEFPGVYTKVAPFANWIREKTGLKNL